MLEEDDIDSPLESVLASFPVRSTGTKNVFLKLSRVDRIVRRIFLRLELLNFGQARWIASHFGSFAVLPRQLARLGFYHRPRDGIPDNVCCFACGAEASYWDPLGPYNTQRLLGHQHEDCLWADMLRDLQPCRENASPKPQATTNAPLSATTVPSDTNKPVDVTAGLRPKFSVPSSSFRNIPTRSSSSQSTHCRPTSRAGGYLGTKGLIPWWTRLLPSVAPKKVLNQSCAVHF